MQNWFTQIAWPDIWNPQEMFLTQPPNPWGMMWLYLGYIAACLLVIIILYFIKSIHPELRIRLVSYAWTNFSLGLLLFACRYYQIPYLSMNLLRFLQIGIGSIWFISIMIFYFKKLPRLILASKVAERRQKYLPSA